MADENKYKRPDGSNILIEVLPAGRFKQFVFADPALRDEEQNRALAEFYAAEAAQMMEEQ